MDIAHDPEMQECGRCRLVIRGIQDEHAILVSQCPEDVLDLDTQLLRLCFEGGCTLGGVVDVLDSLLRKLDRRDVRCHEVSSDPGRNKRLSQPLGRPASGFCKSDSDQAEMCRMSSEMLVKVMFLQVC